MVTSPKVSRPNSMRFITMTERLAARARGDGRFLQPSPGNDRRDCGHSKLHYERLAASDMEADREHHHGCKADCGERRQLRHDSRRGWEDESERAGKLRHAYEADEPTRHVAGPGDHRGKSLEGLHGLRDPSHQEERSEQDLECPERPMPTTRAGGGECGCGHGTSSWLLLNQ